MARERWFYAQGNQRRGPVPLSSLVESVLGQADPRNVLVWRKGFAEWTRSEDVPEVERRIAPFLAKKAAEEAARRAPVVAPAPFAPPPARVVEEAKPGSSALVYGGIAGGAALLVLLGWLFWPRPAPPLPPAVVPLGGTTAENSPAVVIPAPPAGGRPTPTPTPPPVTTTTTTTRPAAPAAAMADRETDLLARRAAEAASGLGVGGRHAPGHRLQRNGMARDRAVRQRLPFRQRRLRGGPAAHACSCPRARRWTPVSPTC